MFLVLALPSSLPQVLSWLGLSLASMLLPVWFGRQLFSLWVAEVRPTTCLKFVHYMV